MSLIAKANSGHSSFTPVPSGSHLARCYRIVDLGTHKSDYKGKISFLRKIMISFEVHGEDDTGKPIVTANGEPLSISKTVTLSIGDKSTLRADLVSWRGKEFTTDELDGFELKNILGVWALITVAKSIGNNGKEYTNIMNINPVPKQMNKPAMFSLDAPDYDLFNSLGDSIKTKIESSPEWEALQGTKKAPKPQSGFDDMDSDIPF